MSEKLGHEGLLQGAYNPRLDGEEESQVSLRPKLLSEFIGQEGLKNNLSVFVKAALERKEALDHLFLIGPPGLGKTTLAQIIAHELGVEMKMTSAPALDKAKDLAGILASLGPGVVFFIDEIHRLKPALEEMLYIAMEDYELDWVIGQGPSARSVRVPLPRFTLVGATTKAGMVSSPLVSRFGITARLLFYTQEDLESIVLRSADIMETRISPQAARLLASSSRGTPRVANRLLKRMRDFAQVAGQARIEEDTVSLGLQRLEVDAFGLEDQDRRILSSIIKNYRGGPVGAETLAISVGEAIETLEDYYEPFLIQQGFLARTPRGRVATPKAYQHLGLRMEDADQRLSF